MQTEIKGKCKGGGVENRKLQENKTEFALNTRTEREGECHRNPGTGVLF